MAAFYTSLDGQQAAGMFVIDPTTGLPSSLIKVAVTNRVCLGTFRATVTTTSQTLAGVIAAAIPTGSATCEIQADGGSIRFRRDAGVPTSTLGYRLDDSMEKLIDTPLADLRLISAGGSSVFVNVVFFDRV